MTDLNSIIERVKKLLALSHSSNINEANAALQKANKLIDEYRLSQAELDANQSEPVIEDKTPIYDSGRRVRWKVDLLGILAKHYGCKHFLHHNGYRQNNYSLIGRKGDIEIVQYMFAWLILEVERLAHAETKRLQHNKSDGKIFCASYCLGFVSGVSEQLKKSRAEANEGASSTAIVAINSRLEDSNAKLNELYPDHVLTKSLNNGRYSNSAYLNGKEKGKNIHLGASLNKAAGVKLLGG